MMKHHVIQRRKKKKNFFKLISKLDGNLDKNLHAKLIIFNTYRLFSFSLRLFMLYVLHVNFFLITSLETRKRNKSKRKIIFDDKFHLIKVKFVFKLIHLCDNKLFYRKECFLYAISQYQFHISGLLKFYH